MRDTPGCRVILLILALLCARLTLPEARAGDSLAAALADLDGLEQAVRKVERGDGHAVGRLISQSKSLLSRLEYVGKSDRGTAQAARQKVLQIARVLHALDTPGNLEIEIADPPKREKAAHASGPPSASDKATQKRLSEIRERDMSPPRALDAGERLGFTERHAALLAKETVRFTDEFGQFVSRWKSDKSSVRSMPTSTWTEGQRYQLDEHLIFSVPDTTNSQLWRSRWYLEAACDGALRRAKEEWGLTPRVIIVGGSGRDAMSWDSGASGTDMLRFAHNAALIGGLFEQRIGGDPQAWQQKQEEIETLARSRAIKLAH